MDYSAQDRSMLAGMKEPPPEVYSSVEPSFWCCDTCSSVVADMHKHNLWHAHLLEFNGYVD
jgi:hypothetical protein